jgi:UDP-4-amino-4,6-dideoxy-N-acetyl-beta-L-altrosamine transaminase
MNNIPYSTQNISRADIDEVCAVLKSAFLTQGPEVPKFEGAFADVHKVKHALAVSSATAGLHIALLALGVGAGSRVWTSPNSFVASANCALYCGAQIDFVDIDPITRNMSTDALREKLGRADSAGQLPDVIIPVHFSGLPCDMHEIGQLARKYKFKVVEDASHATGASYAGAPVGSDHSDIAVFSFHAVKIITTGEGGMVTTNDFGTAQRLRLFRSHGISKENQSMQHEPDGPWYHEQTVLGYNYRMTDIQAAIGTSQLRRLKEFQSVRGALVRRYDSKLQNLPLILPLSSGDRISAWHLYVVEVDSSCTKKSRKEVFQSLRGEGIGVNVHYIPIHTQPFYSGLGFKRGDYPAAERYYSQAISLPLFPAMTEAQQNRVIAALESALYT